MSDDDTERQAQHDWEMNRADTTNDAAAAEIAALKARATTARSWVVLLISDISWLVGSAEGSGNIVPPRITDDLQEALSWLSSEP
jgi:hypothetical protein